MRAAHAGTITMLAASGVTRWAHRAGLAGAVVWWLYAFYATRFFTGLTGPGVLVYLSGLVVVYALLYYAVKAADWLLRNL